MMSEKKPVDNRKSAGKFKKGESGNPKGRIKGSKNKTPTDVKQAFLDTFDELGGVKGMSDHFTIARNRTQFYTLLAKLLPKTIEATLDVNQDIAGQFERDERADKRAKANK